MTATLPVRTEPRRGTTGAALARSLHPVAWWVWALGLATAASRTTNPLLLALIVAVASYVVMSRRGDATWALGFRLYLALGAVIVVTRVFYRFLLGGGEGTTILVDLPELPLPGWIAGIRLLGPVSLESLLGGLYDGLRLAAMLACIGAANSLANPKRLLRAVPAALYEVGTAVVVSLSVFPQLVDSVLRVRRARRLRGGRGRGLHALREIVIPVLTDALDRSLMLAAAMDSRGYGRSGAASARDRLVTGTLMVTGLVGVCVGIYGTLDATTPRYLGAPMLLTGCAVAAGGFVLAGRRVRRTTYRPDRWHTAELLTVACGLAAGLSLYLTARVDPTDLYPSLSPLSWPQLPWLATVGILVAALPAIFTPCPAEGGA